MEVLLSAAKTTIMEAAGQISRRFQALRSRRLGDLAVDEQL
jgi:hypothetical protein